jgi:hypothetical protein
VVHTEHGLEWNTTTTLVEFFEERIAQGKRKTYSSAVVLLVDEKVANLDAVDRSRGHDGQMN